MADGSISGGCACGAVRYTVRDHGFRPYACHCKGCQSRGGSAFAINQQALEADLVVQGETVASVIPGLNDAHVTHFACPKCLTRLYTRNNLHPALITIRTGTRDDSPALVPAFHVWVSRKQPWLVLPVGTPQYSTQPETTEEWQRLVLPEGLHN